MVSKKEVIVFIRGLIGEKSASLLIVQSMCLLDVIQKAETNCDVHTIISKH